MNLLSILQSILLGILAFIPVWAGGQSVICYQQGNLWKATAAILIAVFMIICTVAVLVLALRYNWSFVTFFAALFY